MSPMNDRVTRIVEDLRIGRIVRGTGGPREEPAALVAILRVSALRGKALGHGIGDVPQPHLDRNGVPRVLLIQRYGGLPACPW